MADDLSQYEDYDFEGWDGYGGKPITAETLALARAINDLLKQPPAIAPGGDGTIGFEWCDFEKDHKVFLDVSSDGMSIYARIGEKILQRPKVTEAPLKSHDSA